MPAVDDLLGQLAAHPPSAPTPVGQIRARARRRARHRRARAVAAVVVAALGAGFGLGATVTGDDRPAEDVATAGGPATTLPPSASTGSETPADATITLDPATGHEDGAVVEVGFPEPTSGSITVAQCAREVESTGGGSAVLSWCVGLTTGTAEDPPPFTLSREIETASGRIDCAEGAARCVLGVRVGDQVRSTDDRFAPLVFRDDLPPVVVPEAVIDGADGVVADGSALVVTLTGVETGEVVRIQQCRTDPAAGPAPVEYGPACDTARELTATVQDGPETQLAFTAYHDVYLDGPEDAPGSTWTRCEPCELVVRVGDRELPTTRQTLAFEPTDAPIRPRIDITPGGPHRWGQQVTVRAAGLQPASLVAIGWCPTTLPQGGGGSVCWRGEAEGAATYAVRPDGTVLIEGFALPDPSSYVGTDCAEPGACGVGIDGGDGSSMPAVTPLDMTG